MLLKILLLAVAVLLVGGCTTPIEPLDTATGKPNAPADASDARRAPAAPTLRVTYVDVGQGDGTLWLMPDGSVVVYDCGPPAASPSKNPMVKALRGAGFSRGARIQALVASHGHLDHIGGCDEIFSEYQVAYVYETWYEGGDAPASYLGFREAVKAEGAVVHTLGEQPGLEGERPFQPWDVLELTQAARDAGVRAQIVWPPNGSNGTWDDIADRSIVVRLSFGATDFCFEGDIETRQEGMLAGYAVDLSCEVYLVGHHGSKYASSAAWLEKMKPSHAVVSFGTNPYGHPTPEALCRVQQAGAKVYATHQIGDITISTEGSNLSVVTGQPETKDYCMAGVSYWT